MNAIPRHNKHTNRCCGERGVFFFLLKRRMRENTHTSYGRHIYSSQDLCSRGLGMVEWGAGGGGGGRGTERMMTAGER